MVSSTMASEVLPETEGRALADDFHTGISKAGNKGCQCQDCSIMHVLLQ